MDNTNRSLTIEKVIEEFNNCVGNTSVRSITHTLKEKRVPKQEVFLEHYQIIYVMRQIEHKSLHDISCLINRSVEWVKEVIDSPVFQKMIKADWKPSYLKEDYNVVETTTVPNYDYIDVHIARDFTIALNTLHGVRKETKNTPLLSFKRKSWGSGLSERE